MRVLLCVLSLAVPLVATLSGQTNHHVTKLSRLDEHVAYNDVWGYTAPDGREYALLGAQTGVSVVNVTDPFNPVETGWFPGVTCIWRDMKTFGHYAYAVNDCTGGVQVIDLSNPQAPVLVNEFGLSTIGHAHNIQIDVPAGMLYACGTDVGMAVYNLNVSPTNPPMIKTWKGAGIPGANGYVHDIWVQNGKAHAGLIHDGLYAILNVASLPNISVLSSRSTGQDFTHSTWTNAAGTVAVTVDEKQGDRNIQIWDVSNPASPALLSSPFLGGTTIPHNPYILGEDLHVSYYDEGYVAWDLSDPARPVENGRFDTTPGGGGVGLFSGAWGCYPFAASGLVYVSDIGNGLYVFRLNEDCAADASGRPALCETWPEQIEVGAASLPPEMLLVGKTLAGATQVHVGGVSYGPGQFTVIDDEALRVPIPAGLVGGLLAVSVENALGSSAVRYLTVKQPGAPRLSSGPQQIGVGSSLTHLLDSDAGDLQYLALSLLPQPSIAPNAVAFDIGAAFSNLILFAPLLAGPAGTSQLGPFTIPAAGAGLTVFWQFAAIDGPAGKPWPTSNVAIHEIGF